MTDLFFSPQPKPTRTRKQEKAKARRQESKVIQVVRQLVVIRDGGCRFPLTGADSHEGRLEWAHLEDHRRTKTGGQAPELRHTVSHTCMLCDRHHDLYDARKVSMRFASETHRASGVIHWYDVAGAFLGGTAPRNVMGISERGR